MTFAPAPIRELAVYWSDHGGVPLGIVGNAAHVIGYHLGRDRIYGPGGQGGADYSVQLPRDRAGLSDAAAAIDLGKLDDTYAALRMFSSWLVARAQRYPDVRHEIREIIYSPDGATVQRWSSVDNAIHHGAGNGDDSHLTHTHISFYRDSEDRDKVHLFAPYFEEVDMTHYRAVGEDWKSGGAPVRLTPDRAAPAAVTIPAGAIVRTVAEFEQGGQAWRVTRLPDGRTGFLIRGDLAPLTPGGDPAVDAPFLAYVQRDPIDCSQAIAPYRTAVDQARDALALVP